MKNEQIEQAVPNILAALSTALAHRSLRATLILPERPTTRLQH